MKMNRPKRYGKNDKGSLTVEAVLSLPIFLCFFMLLLFSIKTAVIHITLDFAVNETAKQLATAAYPMTFLNEMEDEAFSDAEEGGIPSLSEEGAKIKGYLTEESSGMLEKLMTGDLKADDIADAFESVKNSVVSDYTSGLTQYLLSSIKGDYYAVKARVKYRAVNLLLDKFLKGGWVEREKTEILYVELPQSDTEYRYRVEEKKDASYTKFYEELGFGPGQDDVVVSLQYKTHIPVPFFADRELAYRFTAVEKAWIHGGNGVYTVHPKKEQTGGEKEGEKEENASTGTKGTSKVEESYKKLQQSTVYVTTKAGKKYHKAGCMHLSKRSTIPLKMDEAQKKGFTPCKRCYGK